MESKRNFILVLPLLYCLLICLTANGQEETDSLKRKTSFIVLPATAYTPETGFTIGGVGEMYFDLAKDGTSRMSKFQLGAIYTTRKQMYVNFGAEGFTKNEDYYYYFYTKYSRFTDQNYGIGNDANVHTEQWFEDDEFKESNYLDFKYQSFGIEGIGLKKIAPGLSIGLHYKFETLWDYELLADSTNIIFATPTELSPGRFEGKRSGISPALNYDTRKNSNNPLDGTFIQFRNFYYMPWLGSDFHYIGVSIDARHYINIYKEHVLAFRLRNEQRYTFNDSWVPRFDLPRVGGKDFARGYYEGTYGDDHMVAFEVEYRLPFFQDKTAPWWKFWRRLGLVVFASGSRVYPDWESFALSDMRYTVGVGGRYALSFDQRVNARLDIGLGLDPKSDFSKRHIGIYIFIQEAF